jgi:hypothetical protein
MAIAMSLSPFLRLAASRTFAGITTCPLEEPLAVDAAPPADRQFCCYETPTI